MGDTETKCPPPAVFKQDISEHSVFNEPSFSPQTLADATVNLTARTASQQHQGSSHTTPNSSLPESLSFTELPAPVKSIQEPLGEGEGTSVKEKKQEPKHNARRAGIQPFWEYLFISTCSIPNKSCDMNGVFVCRMCW